jgi:serine/threonine-protein kinase RsbW
MAEKKKKHFELDIKSHSRHLGEVERLSEKVAKYANLNQSDTDDLGIVTTELVNNAIHHGNKNDPTKKVFISFTVNNSKVELRIKDQGCGFDPDELKDPLAPENLLSESGRGLFLIRNLMDGLEYNFTEEGTEIIVYKKISEPT